MSAFANRVTTAEWEAAKAGEPEPRVPRDATRPFLFVVEQLEDRNDPRLSICPVCGMTDPGNLDGEVRGWPAHQSCQEWLGDWKPTFLPGAEFRPSLPVG